MEVSELDGVGQINQLVGSFACAYVLSIFEFDAD
jgi:hypothetical protein